MVVGSGPGLSNVSQAVSLSECIVVEPVVMDTSGGASVDPSVAAEAAVDWA